MTVTPPTREVIMKIEEQHINFDFIIRYIRELVSEDITDLYSFATDRNIPVAKPETTQLLYILTLIKRPMRILEIGTGIGCSAIVMSKGLSEGGKITTIEKSEDNYKQAIELISDNNLTEKIEVIHSDAFLSLKKLAQEKEKFDFIFLDGAKSQYLAYYPYLMELLDKNGVLVSDNVLFKGMIATDELVIRRKITIVKKLREYLSCLSTNKELHTVIIPIGDGVALSFKR